MYARVCVCLCVCVTQADVSSFSTRDQRFAPSWHSWRTARESSQDLQNKKNMFKHNNFEHDPQDSSDLKVALF